MRPYIFFVVLFFALVKAFTQESKSFLALGDSYTDATSELRKNAWPNQLRSFLQKKDIEYAEPEILAGPGWTTSKLLEEIETSALDTSYDLVSLMIGVNNQYRGLEFEQFENEFDELLRKSVQLANNNPKNVFVVSIPNWGVTPFARLKDKTKITSEIARYNKYINEKCKTYKVLFIDVTALSLNMEVDKILIASDSLHPSKKMYRSWAKRMAKKITKAKN